MSGEIPDGGMLDVLREIETRRITGRLRFSAGGQTGDVAIVAGQIALDQDQMPDGSDPVEVVLKARKGHYVVHQRLPTLPISQGDDDHRNGSLAVHVPADLMNYCESSGVTGTLKLNHEGTLAELIYDAGELLAIKLDGKEDADLSAIFAWDDGSFDIQTGKDVKSLVPVSMRAPSAEDSTEREPTTQFVRPRESTGQHFLKVFEVALTDVVETRERVRPKLRTSPPMQPKPSIRPPAAMPKMSPPPKRPREHTVRIAYLAGDDESAIAAIDHVARQARMGSTPNAVSMETREGVSGEESIDETRESLPPPKRAAKAEKPREDEDEDENEAPSAETETKIKSSRPAPYATETLGPLSWAIAVIVAGVASYYLLSHLLAAS
jgi:hypothetical protein